MFQKPEDVVSLLNTVGAQGNLPITVEINGQAVMMEVDTGAAVSLIPKSVFQNNFRTLVVEKSGAILTIYTGEQITVVGKMCDDQTKQLHLYVVKRERPCLLGRDWLEEIVLDWKQIGMLTSHSCNQKGEIK